MAFDAKKAMAERKAKALDERKKNEDIYPSENRAKVNMERRVATRLAQHESGEKPFHSEAEYQKLKRRYEKEFLESRG